ncbi:MAG: hypothetical protein R3C56_21325 [Pirellulaceae bacterium]
MTAILETRVFGRVADLYADVTSLAGGGHVVVWYNYGFETGGSTSAGVLAQIFDAAGTATSAPFVLNIVTASRRLYPVVEASTTARFVAAWTTGNDGDGYGIRVARYDSTGTMVGTEQLTKSPYHQHSVSPEVAVAADGSFVVTCWTVLTW